MIQLNHIVAWVVAITSSKWLNNPIYSINPIFAFLQKLFLSTKQKKRSIMYKSLNEKKNCWLINNKNWCEDIENVLINQLVNIRSEKTANTRTNKNDYWPWNFFSIFFLFSRNSLFSCVLSVYLHRWRDWNVWIYIHHALNENQIVSQAFSK